MLKTILPKALVKMLYFVKSNVELIYITPTKDKLNLKGDSVCQFYMCGQGQGKTHLFTIAWLRCVGYNVFVILESHTTSIAFSTLSALWVKSLSAGNVWLINNVKLLPNDHCTKSVAKHSGPWQRRHQVKFFILNGYVFSHKK